MTRFKKEMIKRFDFPFDAEENIDENGAYCIEKEALIVCYSPGLILVYQFDRAGNVIDVSNDYPQITHKYLVILCNGDTEKAKEIIKGTSF